MNSSTFTVIKAKDAKDQIREYSGVRDEHLSRLLKLQAFVDSRRRVVLLRPRQSALMFETRDEAVAWAEALLERRAPRLDELLPSGREFGRRAAALAERLLEELGEAGTVWDDVLVGRVEKRLRRMRREEVLSAPLLEAVVALVGECIRRQKDGEWWMRKTDEGWEPWVVTSCGMGIPVLECLKELHERFPAPSLKTFVSSALGSPSAWLQVSQFGYG